MFFPLKRKDEYISVNPMQQVPAFVVEGTTLTQSVSTWKCILGRGEEIVVNVLHMLLLYIYMYCSFLTHQYISANCSEGFTIILQKNLYGVNQMVFLWRCTFPTKTPCDIWYTMDTIFLEAICHALIV